MEFQVLGHVAVVRDGEVVRPAGLIARTLLSALLSRRDTPVPVDVLTDLLWPAGDRRGSARRLHVHVSRLRTTLGEADRLRFEQDAYRLRVRPDELDATRFLAMVDAATELADTDPVRCAELARAALARWRGDPYGGLDLPLALDDVARLRERRLAALEALYRAEFALGRHAAVLAEVAEFAAAHPLHEPAQWLLISALHRTGRGAEATATYQTVRQRLVDELAVEPGPELRALERRMVTLTGAA